MIKLHFRIPLRLISGHDGHSLPLVEFEQKQKNTIGGSAVDRVFIREFAVAQAKDEKAPIRQI